MDPALTDANERIVTVAQKSVKSILHYTPKLTVMTGGSDGNHLIKAGVPCVITGVQGANIHAENEYASTRSILEMAKIYSLTLDTYLQN